jgi:hypothetical protein
MVFPYMDGQQGSDNGSCIVGKQRSTMFGAQATRDLAAARAAAAGAAHNAAAAWAGQVAAAAGAQFGGAPMGTPALPAAPHNTPVGAQGSGAGFSTPGRSGGQQDNSPALSTASRMRLREQGLQQIRQQLMAGIGGRPEPAAAAAAAVPVEEPGAGAEQPEGQGGVPAQGAQAAAMAAEAAAAAAVLPARYAAQAASLRPIEMTPGGAGGSSRRGVM